MNEQAAANAADMIWYWEGVHDLLNFSASICLFNTEENVRDGVVEESKLVIDAQ